MNIVFFCQSCGARFEVPREHAGKNGKCRQCGQPMTIPRAQDLASMAALPAIPIPEPARAAAPVSTAAAPARDTAGGPNAPFQLSPATAEPPAPREPSRVSRPAMPAASWIEAVHSRVGLAPVSSAAMPALRPKKIALDALADDPRSALYSMVAAPAVSAPRTGAKGRPNMLQAVWRKELGFVQKLMRFVNDASYLVSIPFLILILVGAVLPNRGLALFGATAVVLLNFGRLATGMANLVLIPFREGMVQGILFLIPPITLVYLANNWKKMKRSVKRVIEPAITVALVFLAFTFVPALSGGKQTEGPLLDRIKASAAGLSGEMRTEVEKAKVADLNKLAQDAKAKLQEVEGQVREKMATPLPAGGATLSPGDESPKAPYDRDKALKAIEDRLEQRSKIIQDQS